MKKNRSRKRTLTFERLETKATPAVLLVALAPLDDDLHEQVESMLCQDEECLADQPAAENWQFTHSVYALLRFVDENSSPSASEPTVCSPPTWDQCRVADEMMKLRDLDLRSVIVADQLDSTLDGWEE